MATPAPDLVQMGPVLAGVLLEQVSLAHLRAHVRFIVINYGALGVVGLWLYRARNYCAARSR